MSYPRDVDEIPSAEMSNELLDRDRTLRLGLCPYCMEPLQKHACKMRGREWAMYGDEVEKHIDVSAERQAYINLLRKIKRPEEAK